MTVMILIRTQRSLPKDADCDGVLTDDDCNDEDPELFDAANDVDCDGVLSEDDCDDTDPSLTPEDADLDGFSTCSGDCDDGDSYTYPGAASLDFLYTVEPITGNNFITCSSVGQRPLTESECRNHAISLDLSFEQFAK